MPVLKSPLTADPIRWPAEWDGEIISIHSYLASITPKPNKIEGIVNTNMYAMSKPNMEVKSLLLSERTKPIAACATPPMATNSRSKA